MNGLEAEAPDFRDYLRLLRRTGWIMLLCVVLIPAATYKYSQGLTKVFQASTVLQVQSTAVDSSLLTLPDFSPPQQNIQAIATFVGTSAVADEAAHRLGLPPKSLQGTATAEADTETGFVTITATANTAKRAADVANAFAAALNATREKRGQERIDAAVRSVQDDLHKTPKSDASLRSQRELQLQRLQALRQAQSQNAQVLQPALPGTQIAPHPGRNATVALIFAMLLGAALIAFVERMDRRVHKPEELEQLTGVPFLATIPDDAFPDGAANSPHVREAFLTLRNTLTYFNVDGALESVIVTSGGQGEGKTTVVINLALAYASSGKRVIVVDTDLRKPDLAQRMGIDGSHGLTQVLAESGTLEDSLREVNPFGSGLRVLPAGPVPPNPSALLGSMRMSSLIPELVQDADLVIIDTPPLLVVSDAFPLLDKVSGVVALARLDKTSRDAIRRMLQIIVSTGGRTFGMVATDGKRAIGTGYGVGYGYGYAYGEVRPPRPEAPAATPPVSEPSGMLHPPDVSIAEASVGPSDSPAPADNGAPPLVEQPEFAGPTDTPEPGSARRRLFRRSQT